MIDIAITDYLNVNTKETEELNKDKYLEIEVNEMWKVRPYTLPVIFGALGRIKKGLDKNLRLLEGHLSATELHKITLISPVPIICKVLG